MNQKIILIILNTSKKYLLERKNNLIVFISKQLTQMSQQIIHRHPIATCGLFVFDWTLFYTVSIDFFTL